MSTARALNSEIARLAMKLTPGNPVEESLALGQAAQCGVHIDRSTAVRDSLGILKLRVVRKNGFPYAENAWRSKWGDGLPVQIWVAPPVGALVLESSCTERNAATADNSIRSLKDELTASLMLG